MTEQKLGSDAAASAITELLAAAQAMVERWDTPLWKDAPHTSEFVCRLRDACAAARAERDLLLAKLDNIRMWLNEWDTTSQVELMWDEADGEGWAGEIRIWQRDHPE